MGAASCQEQAFHDDSAATTAAKSSLARWRGSGRSDSIEREPALSLGRLAGMALDLAASAHLFIAGHFH